MHAKEEVERTQIEAVHTLTAKTKKQEKEILTLQEKLDNAIHKTDAYKKSLDAAKTLVASLINRSLSYDLTIKFVYNFYIGICRRRKRNWSRWKRN